MSTDKTEEPLIPGKGKRKAIEVNKEIKKEYSDAEIKQLALEMVKISKDKEALKNEAKAKADDYKAQITILDTRQEEILGVVGLGYQYISAKCEMVRNFDTGNRELYLDGVLIESEPLSAKDHQLDIEDAEAANKAEYTRIEKEEAAKKTAELNALANAEEAELSEDEKKQYDEFVKSGDEEYKSKHYADALVYYKAAQKLKPNNAAINNKVLKAENWIEKKKAEEEK